MKARAGGLDRTRLVPRDAVSLQQTYIFTRGVSARTDITLIRSALSC
jgi:hypothetical protein